VPTRQATSRTPRGLPEEPGLAALGCRARRGDPQALNRLLQRVADPVHRYLVARVRHQREPEEVARDLSQEVLLRAAAHVARCTFATDERLLAWVLTIARNVLVDFARAERNGAAALPDAELAAAWDRASLRAWEARGAECRASRVAALFDEGVIPTMPEQTAELLRLRVLAGAEWKEVAAALGTTAAGAKRRFQRAQATLRGRLLDLLRELPEHERRALDGWTRRLGLAEPEPEA
jgi:RNA polymerase sigma factor (sigma-70 family)